MTLNIGVVGSGIAGLGAAWFLSRRYNVTLYESNGYVGGHTHTIEVPVNGRQVGVDTGFIVFNKPNYPLLTRLFSQLDVKTQSTRMSFSVSLNGGQLEYSGSSLGGLFAQSSNILSTAHWGMIRDILRFNRDAKESLARSDPGSLSLGEFLKRGRYGKTMVDRYLLPMGAAIWSCPADAMRDFPAASFIRFFSNHGLLNLRHRPQWETVCGGSWTYIKRLLATSDLRLRTDDPVVSVGRTGKTIRVRTRGGVDAHHDIVVLGCHADQALAILDNPSGDEKRILGKFSYEKNTAFLHQDTSLMPLRQRAWSSWNYISEEVTDGPPVVSVTYWMNELQKLACPEQFFVSLNPVQKPQTSKIIADMVYEHPVFDEDAIKAQRQLPLIQGREGIWYCGSYTGFGFHEDALRSAVKVAQSLGAAPDWRDELSSSSALGNGAIPAPAL